MNHSLRKFSLFCALTALSTGFSPLFAEEDLFAARPHISYLIQCDEIVKAIDLYQQHRKTLGRHDFEALQSMALTLIEKGVRSSDLETQLISLFAIGIGGISPPIDVLETALSSPQPQTQMAAIQFLSQMQDDRCDELLNRAMASDFFYSRMEAAYQLAARKHRKAAGQIEALMYKLPPELRFFFPEFFALIGTSDAIGMLRKLMDDREVSVRVEAILSAARHERDDLLPTIRASMTHLNWAEQEACAAALGYLKDSKSIAKLQKLALSSSPAVQLAALRSLHYLGDGAALQKICEKAKARDLMAVTLLGEIKGGEEALAGFLKDHDLQIRCNAAIALLKHQDPRCMEAVTEVLIRDTRDIGLEPHGSLGKSLMYWKAIPSAKQHSQGPYDLQMLSLEIREQLLRECLELPEQDFLHLASRLFDCKQTELIPLLVILLENLQTPGAVALLEQKAQTAGLPLVRAYCNLACFRLKKGDLYEERVRRWIEQKKSADMIRFRPMGPWNPKGADALSAFELTPEESSRLLIESYAALADRHNEQSIDLLLESIKSGNQKNRYALAGLLIRAIQ